MTDISSSPSEYTASPALVEISASLFLKNEKGLRTIRDIQPGEVLFSVTGPKISEPTIYSLQWGNGIHIEPMYHGQPGYGHFLNHSCDPTGVVKIIPDNGANGHIEIVARHDLKKGDEVTVDYATMEYDPTVNGMKCECGSPLCRGVITGFKDLDPKTKLKYITEGIIPQYLIDLDRN